MAVYFLNLETSATRLARDLLVAVRNMNNSHKNTRKDFPHIFHKVFLPGKWMQDRARKPNKEFNRISKVSQGTVQGPLRQNFARQCKNMPESSRRNSLGAASMQDHARNAWAGLHQDLLLRRREQEFLLMLAYKQPFRIPPLRQESRRCRDRKPTNALTRMIWKK